MHVMQAVDWAPVLLSGLLAFAEAALGLGAVFPGEVAIVALATSLNATSTAVAMVAVGVGASLGDHVGYLLGRRYGPALAHSGLIRRIGVAKWDSAAELIRAYGVPALLVSRLLPFVRTVMPAVAGASGLRYSRFLLASVLGSAAWGVLWVGAGGVLDDLDLLSSPRGLVGVALATIGMLLLSRWVIGRLRGLRADALPDSALPGDAPSADVQPAIVDRAATPSAP